MLETSATHDEILQDSLDTSLDEPSENLSQQEEEIQGLQAICGSDCISCLDQAGPSNKLEPLKATLLIHVDLPKDQLRLTVRRTSDLSAFCTNLLEQAAQGKALMRTIQELAAPPLSCQELESRRLQ